MSDVQVSKVEQFMQLLEQHQQPLFGYIMGMVHNWNDAQDVFQQTSLVLWQKFDEFEAGTNFAAWASQIARFTALNFLRARKRSQSTFGEALLDQLSAEFESTTSIRHDRQSALGNCLEKLAESQRELIDLCYAPQASIKDIAQQLGRSSQSICNSLNRIRARLFECIDRTIAGEVSEKDVPK